MKEAKEIKRGEGIATETSACPENSTQSDGTAIQEAGEMKIKLNMKQPEQSSGKQVKELLKQKKILSAAESSSACTGSFNIPRQG